MKNNYRIITNNDTLEIVMENKIIKLTLLDRQGSDISSKLLKEIFIPKAIEGYDTPQFEVEPDCIDIIDSFYFHDMEIWGVKDKIYFLIPDEEIEYKEELCWYFDRKIKEG